jgi:predicted flavoprotein YhiN
MNKLIEHLIRCPFEIKGKTTFKEEFVTCGGIDLRNVNLDTMEIKAIRNVYFAGRFWYELGVFGWRAWVLGRQVVHLQMLRAKLMVRVS